MSATLRETSVTETYVIDFDPAPKVQEYGRPCEIVSATVSVRNGGEPEVSFRGYSLTKNGNRHGASTLGHRFVRDPDLRQLAVTTAGLA